MHNPEKNRVLCVVAKGSYWTLMGGLILLAIAMFGGMLLVLALVGYDAWTKATINWWAVGETSLIVAGVFVAVALVLVWYDWAKAYREDC